MIEQRSDDWFKERLGKVTASKVGDILKKTKSGYSTSRANYMGQLLCERLTGNREETFQSAAMARGVELEDFARIAYEAKTGLIVEEASFVIHPDIENFGASPDGVITGFGLVEIKCPNTMKHIDFLRTGKIDTQYDWQMRAQMACTNSEWCDFVSYDDRLPESLQLDHVRVHRCEVKEKHMIDEVKLFLEELAELEIELKRKAA